MNDYTVNSGYNAWYSRNQETIPSGAKMRVSPAPAEVVDGTEVIWEFEDEAELRDTFVSFIWAADGTPVRGDYQIVDWSTDEVLDSGALKDEDALARVLKDAATAAAA